MVVEVTRKKDRDGPRSNACYACGKEGHRKFECPDSNRDERPRRDDNYDRRRKNERSESRSSV